MLDMPYFMQNKAWYEFDFKKRRYVLTKQAPPKAKESYSAYMKALRAINP